VDQTLATVLIVELAAMAVSVLADKDILEAQELDLMQILKILIKAVAVVVQEAAAQVLQTAVKTIEVVLEAIA
jgi:hypothetical protein